MSSARALEAPRPLKSTIKQQSLPIYHQQQSFEVNSIEDLISLTESVAQSLNQGDVSYDLLNKMFINLQMHGAQLEIYSKEILDRCFNVFRNASQDDRLKISVRLNLLNLIELRANSWINKCADYYKSKANEPENELSILGSSPSMLSGLSATSALTLAPGEVVKNSGKFTKPTKIPGKNYSKDEIIIRNSDSGKVMGIKGRRVHIIEEMSSCVISFQRVNPGAKERLVQITGPNEESINYAKMLIEDTIKRNASPIREASQEGSVSSLASSDDQQMSARPRQALTSVGSIHMQSIPNFVQQMPKLTRSNSHHSSSFFSQNHSNDLTLGEFKYTVTIGHHSLKIIGDNLKLVQAAKLILDDFFTNEEFLKSNEVVTMNAADIMIPVAHHAQPLQSDSGVNLDFLARSSSGVNVHGAGSLAVEPTGDDDVFLRPRSPQLTGEEINILTSSSSIESSSSSNTVTEQQSLSATNALSRSRRSHFSRKDSTPDQNKTKNDADPQQRICYSIQSLWWFCNNLPLCKCSPENLETIRETCPFIVRDKNQQGDIIRYSDVERFLELRKTMDKSDDVIEINDDD